MADNSSNDTAAAETPAASGTDSLLQMATGLLEETATGINDPAAAEAFLQQVLNFVAQWKLVNAPTDRPDMSTVFGQADMAQKRLNSLGADILKTGALDIYTYGGVATENAIAVLMETARVAPKFPADENVNEKQ